MSEMVESALVQEVVSRAVGLLLGNREEKPSKDQGIRKLEMLLSQLEFALETSKNLPIVSMPLLFQRQQLKRGYEECSVVLRKHKRRALEDQEAKQAVTRSSFPTRIVHAMRSFFIVNRDELSSPDVGTFEWYADRAGKFIRDVESSCSLARYRFFSPFIRPLLEGKGIKYHMEQGNQSTSFFICPVGTEEHGVLALLSFSSYDHKIQTKCFDMFLLLRLSESTDIIGIATECLQSIAPQFNSLAQVAIGELSQLPTQDFIHAHSDLSRWSMFIARAARPDLLCCRANRDMPCANSMIPSKLSCRFSEPVIDVSFHCSISASEYKWQSSVNEAERNIVGDWPPLKLSAIVLPHFVNKLGESYASKRVGEVTEHINRTSWSISLQEKEEIVLKDAITYFIRQPELTDYRIDCASVHGRTCLAVEKPKEKVRPKPRAGPKDPEITREKVLAYVRRPFGTLNQASVLPR